RAGGAAGIEGQTIQLGTGTAPSIGDIFAAACRVVGVDATAELDAKRLRPETSEVMTLQSDYARAQALLGWAPTVELDAGLARTAEWVRQNLHLYRRDFYV